MVPDPGLTSVDEMIAPRLDPDILSPGAPEGPVFELAQAQTRDDWRGPAQPTGFRGLDASLVELLGRAWTHEGLREHLAVADTSRTITELLHLGAPSSLVHEATTLTGIRIQLARASFALATRYLGRSIGPGPIRRPELVTDDGHIELAVRMVHEGCVRETYAAIEASVAADLASDLPAKTALVDLSEGRHRHAVFAWRTLVWVLDAGPQTTRSVVADAFSQARLQRPSHIEHWPQVLRDHGRLGPTEIVELQASALRDVIAPGAGALLQGKGVEHITESAEPTTARARAKAQRTG